MTFNSFTFVLFFLAVFAASKLPIPWSIRKGILLFSSYVFYAAWNPLFVVLLWISTLLDWWVAREIAKTTSLRLRDLLLGISLLANFGLLAYFKYGLWILDNVLFGSRYFGIAIDASIPGIILPVGISFYTFQTLSYTIDVYKGVLKPTSSLLDFSLYVTFFPQLVAGPIVRASEFLPQCADEHRAGPLEVSWGMMLLLLGLFEKVVLADSLLGPIVETVYGNPEDPAFVTSWTGAFAFAGQIFCDFAGYSHCAIGTALCLGFALPDNFRCPYAAEGFSDFWHRWHISLSTWLRDYLYIPLGGSRGGTFRTLRNLMITMTLGGLWHGAAWTFLIWGALHGLLLILERTVRSTQLARWNIWTHSAGRLVIRVATLLLICATWVPFRSKSWHQLAQHWTSMAGLSASGYEWTVSSDAIAVVWITFALLVACQWRMRDHSLESLWNQMPGWLRIAILAGMLSAICLLPGEDRAFIYFQF